ncbi:hypothetical protein [Streptomyces sp. NPDC086989]|uniref:hypothetical protein n=1 Tax=Streptomyces sp. NPDC086989 TaxID=3365764 RepID=UPI00382B32B2
MRAALLRRTVLTASAASLALLAGACGPDAGGSDTGGTAGAGPSAAASTPAAPPAKGKTDAELSALLVTQADLPDLTVTPVAADAAKAAAGAAAKLVSDVSECLPGLRAMVGAPIGTPTGTAVTTTLSKARPAYSGATEEEKELAALNVTQTEVSLYSYDGEGAREAFRSFERAGLACRQGFTPSGFEGLGLNLGYTQVKGSAKVAAGDESQSHLLVMETEGAAPGRMTLELVVVRRANTLAVFVGESPSTTAEQPKEVVAAQAGKLG